MSGRLGVCASAGRALFALRMPPQGVAGSSSALAGQPRRQLPVLVLHVVLLLYAQRPGAPALLCSQASSSAPAPGSPSSPARPGCNRFAHFAAELDGTKQDHGESSNPPICRPEVGECRAHDDVHSVHACECRGREKRCRINSLELLPLHANGTVVHVSGEVSWRRGRDSNPRRAINPHTLSRRAT